MAIITPITPTQILTTGVQQTLAQASSCGDKFKPQANHDFIRVLNGSASVVTVTVPTTQSLLGTEVNSVCASGATAGLSVVTVAIGEGTKFSIGMTCTIADSAGRERCVIESINANAITMVGVLANNYTTGRTATLWIGSADIIVAVDKLVNYPDNDKTIAFDTTSPVTDYLDADGYVNIGYSTVTTVTVGVFRAD